MAKSTTRSTADVANVVGRKNLIINGDMQVSQRGDYTSATPTVSTTTYYLDRMQAGSNIVSSTVQHTDVTINGVSKKAMKVVATSSATGYIVGKQRVELGNIQVGETYTVSCWVRTNNAYTSFRHNIGGSYVGSPYFTNDGNWEKVSLTMDSTGTTSSPLIQLITYTTAGATVAVTTGDYIEFTDFQLELGSVATDFEHRSYGEELALCQRYYQRLGGTAYTPLGTGISFSTIARGCTIDFVQTMRVVPTASIVNIMVSDRTSFDNLITGVASFSANMDKASFGFNLQNAIGNNGIPVQVVVTYSTLGHIAFDAEL